MEGAFFPVQQILLVIVGTLNPVTVTCMSRACFNADLFGVCVCLWLSIIPLSLEKRCACPTVDYCLGVFLHGAAS